jgi:hypothetical protein
METHSPGLRTAANSANPALLPAAADLAAAGHSQDSQTFAAAENRTSTSDSQDSQDSQGGGLPLHSRDPRLARLLRWGWPLAEAQALAARLARRDATDDRVVCVECSNYRPGRCTRHRAAGLLTADVGRELAALPQRCAAYKPTTTDSRTIADQPAEAPAPVQSVNGGVQALRDADPPCAPSAQAVPAAARTCRACVHHSQNKTCLEPVRAGLTQRWRLVWPPDGHAETCPAFESPAEGGAATPPSTPAEAAPVQAVNAGGHDVNGGVQSLRDADPPCAPHPGLGAHDAPPSLPAEPDFVETDI